VITDHPFVINKPKKKKLKTDYEIFHFYFWIDRKKYKITLMQIY
jgi:hypothetical protein